MTRDHAEHGALTHAGTGEDTHALAAANREQTIDGANASLQGTVDGLAQQGIRGLGRERHALDRVEFPLAIDGMSEAVQYTAQQPGAHVDSERTAKRLHTCAGVQAIEFTEWHEQHAALVEAHHLGEYRAVARVAGDAAERPESDIDAGGFHHQPHHARHAAVLTEAIGARHAVEQDVERRGIGRVGLGAESGSGVGGNHAVLGQA